ncbi:MAG: CDP-alcohol phosphatidyltransferase family protein [Candidatus Paceibacterota bacterium]|jgi:phosphatidylserine synthase
MKKYLLVNTITAISLILGLIAIYFAVHGYLYFSFGFALLAFVTDSLDGFLARKLGAESRFGAIFDTLTDIIVYLMYPAIILFNEFGMSNIVGLSSIGLFLLAGVFRLVRFTNNGFEVEGEKKYYLGMPVFFSHFIVMIMMVVNMLDKQLLQIVGPLILVTMSLMMVTKLRFRKPTSIFLGIFICMILTISIFMFCI